MEIFPILEPSSPEALREHHGVAALPRNPLLQEMLRRADPSQVPGLSRFFKCGPGEYGEGDLFLGIKVPVTREVVRERWKNVTWADLEECISSEYHEVRLAALLSLVEIFSHAGKKGTAENYFSEGFPKNQFSADKLREQCVNFYLSHTDRINNWDLVDLSCYPLLGQWLLDKDRTILYDLARSGKTLWEQRIGMVSTMTFIRHGQLDDTFAIADILLHHPHDLIHKAVGWLLREAGKRDRARLDVWLQTSPKQAGDAMHDIDHTSLPRYRQMPRTMLRYAIEKFPEADRRKYLKGEV